VSRRTTDLSRRLRAAWVKEQDAKLFGSRMQNVDWETKLERMPDNAPPKWMFSNITAIRQNTDRILELAERANSQSTAPATAAS
jgi:hypothetical protein